MRISITRDSGEVFAIHDVSEQMAEHLRYRLQDVNPVFGQDRLSEPDHAPGDTEAQSLLTDLGHSHQGNHRRHLRRGKLVVAFPLATALLAQGPNGAIGPGPLTMAGWLLTAAAWPTTIINAWITQDD